MNIIVFIPFPGALLAMEVANLNTEKSIVLVHFHFMLACLLRKLFGIIFDVINPG